MQEQEVDREFMDGVIDRFLKSRTARRESYNMQSGTVSQIRDAIIRYYYSGLSDDDIERALLRNGYSMISSEGVKYANIHFAKKYHYYRSRRIKRGEQEEHTGIISAISKALGG